MSDRDVVKLEANKYIGLTIIINKMKNIIENSLGNTAIVTLGKKVGAGLSKTGVLIILGVSIYLLLLNISYCYESELELYTDLEGLEQIQVYMPQGRGLGVELGELDDLSDYDEEKYDESKEFDLYRPVKFTGIAKEIYENFRENCNNILNDNSVTVNNVRDYTSKPINEYLIQVAKNTSDTMELIGINDKVGDTFCVDKKVNISSIYRTDILSALEEVSRRLDD